VSHSSSRPLEITLTPGRAVLSFTQITPGDLDVAVFGQLAATHFPLRDQFKTGAVKVVGFKAPLRDRRLFQQRLKYPAGHANDALVFADANAELNRCTLRIPACIRGKP